MSSLDVPKNNEPDSCYYVSAKGYEKQFIFRDDADFCYFCSLFENYYSPDTSKRRTKPVTVKLNGTVEVLAYCLMPNNFHILLHQIERDGMSKLMNGAIEGYSNYFYDKYETTGPILENCYKISNIPSDDSLLGISRNIHLTPDGWMDYPYSSIRSYLYDDAPCWVNKKRISELYGSAEKYLKFLQD